MNDFPRSVWMGYKEIFLGYSFKNIIMHIFNVSYCVAARV